MKTFILLLSIYFPQPHAQKVFMVWDGQNQAACPLDIEVLPSVKLEIPLDDNGKLISSEAKVTGIVAKYVSKCGRIEVRPVPSLDQKQPQADGQPSSTPVLVSPSEK